MAERLAAFVPANERATFKVLDIAAGTGLVGHFLYELGFRIFDAVGGCSFAEIYSLYYFKRNVRKIMCIL